MSLPGSGRYLILWDNLGCNTVIRLSLVATPSLLRKVIESQGQDAEISSIKDRVQSCTGDEGWAIHTDASL